VKVRPRRKKASTEEIAVSILQGKLVDVLPLLRCPRTGSELKPTMDGSLVAKNGDRRYPVVDGVPVLIDDEHSLVDITWALESRRGRHDAGAPPSGFKLLAQQALRRLPSSDRNVAARRNYRRLLELLRVRAASGREPRVLVVGGRIEGAGSEELLACTELQVIETDIAFGPRTDVVCDGHDLPFADRTFDAIVIQAVLDCVVEPQRVASEVHRVLAADGLVYSEAGFIQQAHTGAFDFNRFTHLGHRRLWRFFDEVDSGAQCGPAMAMLWSIEYFLRAFVGESRVLGTIAERAVALGGFWLKYLDGFLVRRPGGIDAASGTFFLGTRRDTPVPDRAIVAGFRGIPPRGQRLPAMQQPPAEIAGLPADEEIRASRGIRIRRRERTASGV
jgi:SAM-dependent methyltransferase